MHIRLQLRLTLLRSSDGFQSHPYAFTPASGGDGWVIAGLTLRNDDHTPQGRIVKVSSSTLQVVFDVSMLKIELKIDLLALPAAVPDLWSPWA